MGSHLGVGCIQDETDTQEPAGSWAAGCSWLVAGRPGKCRSEKETEVVGTGLYPGAGEGAEPVAEH